MNRLNFIKSLAGVGALASLPTESEANTSSTDVRPNELAIMIYDEYIAGFRYHKGPKNLSKLQVEDEVKLVREPKNRYDEFAVAIHWQEKMIGYIRMDDNIVIANLIDNDLPLFCKISEIKPEAETWEQVAISLYLLYPAK